MLHDHLVHVAVSDDQVATRALHEVTMAGKETLMCDGVYHLNHEELKGLADKGARVVVCAHNAIERKVDKKDFVTWGSQYDLACMVKECDRFLAFN